MLRLLAVLVLAGGSATAQTSATESSEQEPIVGKWRWFNKTVVEIKANGTFFCGGQFMGKWKCTDAQDRSYTIQWGEGAIEDYGTLSYDGTKLRMRNHDGFKHTAVKINPL
jgi:hypothetical protein